MSALTTKRDALYTLLTAIASIGSVSKQSRILFEDIPASHYPALDLLIGDFSYVYRPTSEIEAQVNFVIRGATNTNDRDDLYTLIQRTENAILANHTLTGTVIDCVPIRFLTDEGYLNKAVFEMTVVCHYVYAVGGA